MSSIQHELDLVSLHLTRDPCLAASKEKLWLRILAIWDFLPQADFQILLDSMSYRIAALIAAHGG